MGWVDAAGIDHGKDAPIPIRIAEQTVTGGAWGVVHDRHAFADKAVKKGRFADVGSAYKCNNWFHVFRFFMVLAWVRTWELASLPGSR